MCSGGEGRDGSGGGGGGGGGGGWTHNAIVPETTVIPMLRLTSPLLKYANRLDVVPPGVQPIMIIDKAAAGDGWMAMDGSWPAQGTRRGMDGEEP